MDKAENTIGEVAAPTSPPPVTPRKFFSRKVLIIVGVVAIILVSVFVFAVIWSSRDAATPSGATVTESQEEVLGFDPQKLAGEIGPYLDSQRDENGFYDYYAQYDEICAEGGYCPFGDQRMYETTNSWAALGHFGEYKVTQSEEALDEALQDIEIMKPWCLADTTRCLWVMAQPEIVYVATENESIRELVVQVGDSLVTAPIDETAMLAAIESRSLAKLYEITDDIVYFNQAQLRLNQASENLTREQNSYLQTNPRFAKGSCWVSLASIEIANTTNGNLNNPASFLDNGRILENLDYIASPIDIQPCIESYLELYRASGDRAHFIKARDLMRAFLTRFYDGPDNPLVNGEGGTIFNPEAIEEGADRIVTFTDSAYTLYLLGLFEELQ